MKTILLSPTPYPRSPGGENFSYSPCWDNFYVSISIKAFTIYQLHMDNEFCVYECLVKLGICDGHTMLIHIRWESNYLVTEIIRDE